MKLEFVGRSLVCARTAPAPSLISPLHQARREPTPTRNIADRHAGLQRLVHDVKAPCGTDDGWKIGMRWPEVQHLARGRWIGDQIGGIAGAARLDGVRHGAARLGRNRSQDLQRRQGLVGKCCEFTPKICFFTSAAAPL